MMTILLIVQNYIVVASLPNASTITKTVTVNPKCLLGSNKYFIDGSQQPTLNLYEGHTYKFDQSDGTNLQIKILFRCKQNNCLYYLG